MLRRLIVMAVLAAATPALALDLPARKPGLWERSVEAGPRARPQISRLCIDAATDQSFWRHDLGDGKLCPTDVGSSGGSITVDYSCRVREVTSTAHVVISGDFKRAYTWDISSSFVVPGRAAPLTDRYVIAYKYIGPCEADQRPGDMIMSDGMRMPVVRDPKQP